MLRGVADSQRGKDRNSPNETAEGSFYLSVKGMQETRRRVQIA